METTKGVFIRINDYTQPQEVRDEVVQAICDAFLRKETGWRTFFPHCGDYGQNATLYIDLERPYFNYPSKDKPSVRRIRGCEMRAAFDALRAAGYHMFSTYKKARWIGYTCEKKPYLKGGVEVESFEHFID